MKWSPAGPPPTPDEEGRRIDGSSRRPRQEGRASHVPERFNKKGGRRHTRHTRLAGTDLHPPANRIRWRRCSRSWTVPHPWRRMGTAASGTWTSRVRTDRELSSGGGRAPGLGPGAQPETVALSPLRPCAARPGRRPARRPPTRRARPGPPPGLGATLRARRVSRLAEARCSSSAAAAGLAVRAPFRVKDPSPPKRGACPRPLGPHPPSCPGRPWPRPQAAPAADRRGRTRGRRRPPAWGARPHSAGA